MAFAKKIVSEEALKEGGNGSKYITKSGIYDVNIIVPFVSLGKGGSTSVDFYVTYNNQAQTIYGNLRVANNDGSENEIGMKTFNKLLVVADIDEVADPIDGELPIGKNNAMKEVPILESLEDIDCKIAVVNEYGKYNGSYTQKQIIRNFYTADGRSASEVVSGAEPAQLDKDLEYMKDVYKDGVTPEEIEAWAKAKYPKNTAGGAPATSAKAAPSFKRKSFKKA